MALFLNMGYKMIEEILKLEKAKNKNNKKIKLLKEKFRMDDVDNKEVYPFSFFIFIFLSFFIVYTTMVIVSFEHIHMIEGSIREQIETSKYLQLALMEEVINAGKDIYFRILNFSIIIAPIIVGFLIKFLIVGKVKNILSYLTLSTIMIIFLGYKVPHLADALAFSLLSLSVGIWIISFMFFVIFTFLNIIHLIKGEYEKFFFIKLKNELRTMNEARKTNQYENDLKKCEKSDKILEQILNKNTKIEKKIDEYYKYISTSSLEIKKVFKIYQDICNKAENTNDEKELKRISLRLLEMYEKQQKKEDRLNYYKNILDDELEVVNE